MIVPLWVIFLFALGCGVIWLVPDFETGERALGVLVWAGVIIATRFLLWLSPRLRMRTGCAGGAACSGCASGCGGGCGSG